MCISRQNERNGIIDVLIEDNIPIPFKEIELVDYKNI